MSVSIGRIVHYKLSASDAEAINRRRVEGAGHGESWPAGAQAHAGNPVSEGQVLPAVVVQVFSAECCNLKVLLDGNDDFWATSVVEGDVPGSWAWPKRE